MVDLVLTSTERLARRINMLVVAEKRATGVTAWLAPTVLGFSVWTSLLRDEYFLMVDDDRTLVSEPQALLLWQQVIADGDFIDASPIARVVQRSWRLLHEYHLPGPHTWGPAHLSEDRLLFREWVAQYKEACTQRQIVDPWQFNAEIPAHLAEGLIEAPGSIELTGFDLPMTPLQQKIIDACVTAGSKVVHTVEEQREVARLGVTLYDHPDEELLASARWARACLEENADQSIAVVVPSLSGRVDRVDKLFRQVFDPPSFVLREGGDRPWHISLGKPLAEWPLVSDALAFLELNHTRVTQPIVTRLLKSPFLEGWQEDWAAYDALLLRFAREAPYDLGIDEVVASLSQVGVERLAEALAAWSTYRRENSGTRWPSVWAARFAEELVLLGYGDGRPLDSVEYQVLERWKGVLEHFSVCDSVLDSTITRRQALSILQEQTQVVFREQNRGVPVEILGIEEALGSQFHGLWITSLDSDTWPRRVSRDPLIPGEFQPIIPRATANGCLHWSCQELDGLIRASSQVVGSFARGLDNLPKECTTLLKDCQIAEAARPWPISTPNLEDVGDDTHAPALAQVETKGGTGVLRDQSACPFRAFAHRRLNALDVPVARPGVDAAWRGILLHRAFEQFWTGLRGSEDLVRLSQADLEDRIRSVVERGLDHVTSEFRYTLSPSARRLEQNRVGRLMQRWLEVEKDRGAFVVVENEYDVVVRLAGLELNGTIDRIDELADGTLLLIDYKTGRSGKGDWLPQLRIVDPQLPAYAVTMDVLPGGVTFARLRPDDLKYNGLSDRSTDIDGIVELSRERRTYKAIASWDGLLAGWRSALTALADDFKQGVAVVDPRKPTVCGSCHLTSLCRIVERGMHLNVEEIDGDE